MVNRTPSNPQKVSYTAPPRAEPPPDGTQVRCIHCDRDLIGIWQEGKLHIKYRERDMKVQGIIEVHCRFCHSPMTIDTGMVSLDVHYMPWGDRPGDWFEKQENLLTVSSEVDATDSAKKLAEEHKIDLSTVEGTGKDGRIVKPDVEALLELKNT
jgi:hypothetical protein